MAQAGEPVVLHVYDLSQGLARAMSMSLLGKFIEGIWHTGVSVYGREYFFGGGIQVESSGQTQYGVPVKRIPLGYTEVPLELLEEYIEELRARYTVQSYSLLRNNCNNFSNELANFLTGSGIPDDILKLPGEVMNTPMGAMFAPMVQQLETTLKYGGIPQVPQQRPEGVAFGGASVPMPSQPASQGPGAFPGVQVPAGPSVQAAFNPLGAAGQRAPAKASTATPSTPPLTEKQRSIPSAVEFSAVAKGQAAAAKEVDSTEGVKQGPSSRELLEKKEQVQQEIKEEFAKIMAEGSLRASEAAARALSRVLERHGVDREMAGAGQA